MAGAGVLDALRGGVPVWNAATVPEQGAGLAHTVEHQTRRQRPAVQIHARRGDVVLADVEVCHRLVDLQATNEIQSALSAPDLFTVKSTIANYIRQGRGIILCLYDVVKFFDREHLRNGCSELYKLDIKGTIYR